MAESFTYGIVSNILCQKVSRAGVPYIRRIDEGLVILNDLNVHQSVKDAFAMHAVVQSDEDLKANSIWLTSLSSTCVMLTMEYRNIANQGLRERYENDPTAIKLSPLEDVNKMLIADKVQNYHSFQASYKTIHPEADRLEAYFLAWFNVLGISRPEVYRLGKLVGYMHDSQ